MKKVIDKGREPVIHYFCDGCKRQVVVPPENLNYAVQVVGNFGYGPHDGYVFNHAYCEDCAIKAIEGIEAALGIKIQSGDNIGFPCDEEDESNEEVQPIENSLDETGIPSDVREGWD